MDTENRIQFGADQFVLPTEIEKIENFEEQAANLKEFVKEFLGETDKFPYDWQFKAAIALC